MVKGFFKKQKFWDVVACHFFSHPFENSTAILKHVFPDTDIPGFREERLHYVANLRKCGRCGACFVDEGMEYYRADIVIEYDRADAAAVLDLIAEIYSFSGLKSAGGLLPEWESLSSGLAYLPVGEALFKHFSKNQRVVKIMSNRLALKGFG